MDLLCFWDLYGVQYIPLAHPYLTRRSTYSTLPCIGRTLRLFTVRIPFIQFTAVGSEKCGSSSETPPGTPRWLIKPIFDNRFISIPAGRFCPNVVSVPYFSISVDPRLQIGFIIPIACSIAKSRVSYLYKSPLWSLSSVQVNQQSYLHVSCPYSI